MNTLKKLTLPVLTQKDSCLLAELSNACAVSGNEREVRKIVRREIDTLRALGVDPGPLYATILILR